MLKLSTLQAIIFDLDGTLIDSAEDLRRALNLMLSDVGLRSITVDEIRSMIGDGAAKLVERALAAAGGDLAHRDTLVERFLEIYEANPVALTRCYPGVVETLDALARHFRLAVATNKPVIAATKIIHRLALDRLIAVVIGGDSLPQRKPDPAPLLEVLRQFAIGAEQALFVGDNLHDVEAAHKAGMPCVVVGYGYHHRPPSELGADRVIGHFNDLLPLLIGETRDSCVARRSRLETFPHDRTSSRL